MQLQKLFWVSLDGGEITSIRKLFKSQLLKNKIKFLFPQEFNSFINIHIFKKFIEKFVSNIIINY